MNAAGAYSHTALGRFDARVLAKRGVRFGLFIALLAVLVVPSVQAVDKIQEIDVSIMRGERGRSALGRWLQDAEALKRGEDAHGFGHWFPTPTINLLAIVPLTYVSPAVAAGIWSAAKIIAALAGMSLLAGAAGSGGRVAPAGVLLMAALFSFRPVIGDLQHGNLNLFLLGELAVVWWLFVRGRDVAAGIVLGLAVTTKVTPALLVVYFVYKRAWRAVAGAAIGVLLFFVIVPGLFLGFERTFVLLRSWFDTIVVPYAVDGFVSMEIANQSLPGVLMRWARQGGLFSVEYAENALESDMARPATAMGKAIMLGAKLAVVGALAWLCRPQRTRVSRPEIDQSEISSLKSVSPTGPRLFLEFSLVLLAMLLLSERTWKHHAVTLPIVYLAVWRELACELWSTRFTRWFVVGLCVQWFALMASGEGLFGDELADRMLNSGVFCLGLLLCFVQTAMLLRMPRMVQ